MRAVSYSQNPPVRNGGRPLLKKNTEELSTTLREAELQNTRQSRDVNEDHTGGRKREARRDLLFLFLIHMEGKNETGPNYLPFLPFFLSPRP